MLRMEARMLGLSRDYIIFDEADSMEVLRRLFNVDERAAKELYYLIEQQKISAPSFCDPENPISLMCSRPTAGLHEPTLENKLKSYQKALHKAGALDFADLICYARAMLVSSEKIRERWQNRYRFIQVDEILDTHESEYEIISILAQRSRNIALIGDIDQTIYEWRGSEPATILRRFREEFAPVSEFNFSENFRGTRIILEAADAIAESLQDRKTSIKPRSSCENGRLIGLHMADSEAQEARWIAVMIKEIAERRGFSLNKMAVLGRVNRRLQLISDELEQMQVPCYTVEKFEFFRRQEVKDALAWLKFLLHPEDNSSFVRMLLRPPKGIGQTTIRDIAMRGEGCGLRLTDMASTATEEYGEPFGGLINELEYGNVTVLDVETTGLSRARDEVIEVAAVKIKNGKTVERFHSFIRNSVPVQDSVYVHGWTDEHLRDKGRPPEEVFRELARFIGDAPLIGHNIRFDLGMLRAHAGRIGVAIPESDIYDTWTLSRRLFPDLYDYRLGTVCREAGLSLKPSHKAAADVDATAALLMFMLPGLKKGAAERRRICGSYYDQFKGIRTGLNEIRRDISKLRPGMVLVRAMEISGLRQYYEKVGEERRLEHLNRLVAIFNDRDNPELAPAEALADLVEYAALAKNVDHILDNENRAPLITVHQSKGLEFDVVFIAGAVEGEIPSYQSIQENRLEEEKRLFYVAMTRAKKELYISFYNRSESGWPRNPSSFLQFIPDSLMEGI
jgi:DNA helicase-2/ATP-dependent DNA helicase PcrA